MSKRVVAIAVRSLVDKTPICVWEHEILILEQIHGDGTILVVPRDQLAENDTAIVLKGTMQVVDPKSQSMKVLGDKVEISTMVEGKAKTITHSIERIPLADLLAAHWGLDDVFDGDAEQEYVRCAGLYGMHPEHRMPVVEYVYGRLQEGRFEKALFGERVAEPA